MREPTFFILGAPKCGTTSLAAWLAEHPAVYMSPEKEPAHFAADLKEVRPDLHQYRALFARAGPQHLAVGEASTCYLFSREAVRGILKSVSSPRFIVCLRHPIDMVRSVHQQVLFGLQEDVHDFDKAWRLQDSRQAGRDIPRTCLEPWLLQYRARCLLGEQVDRLLRQVGRERVLFLLLEDMQSDPRALYVKVLEFLELPDDGRMQFPVLNRAKEPRSRLFKEGVRHLSRIRLSVGVRCHLGIRLALERWNTREVPPTVLTQTTTQELRRCFSADILKLGALIDRDLSHWLS